MNTMHITFIGFGEVAALFSEAVQKRGAIVCAYDILIAREKGLETLQRRARVPGLSFLPIAEAMKGADLVLSTVTTHAALAAAEACSPYLEPNQTYIDLNAAAPSLKRAIAEVVQGAGAHFVEGAILGAVGITGADTKILIGGPHGPKAALALTQLGLHAVFYSTDIGKASSFKMLRSVFSKGLEALLIEFLVAGRRAGIESELWNEITELFKHDSFDRVAANWIETHATAHERRYHEMKQVTEVLREIGLDPLLTSCTEAFFKRSCEMGMKESFAGKPATRHEVIEFMEKRL
ncbi:MAG: NAD(P)-dependent oxidoreductase [Spirochaetales bacterium]|nr:NAD(P)-dependent oxidoreductase [Spirochaetales bacterium]